MATAGTPFGRRLPTALGITDPAQLPRRCRAWCRVPGQQPRFKTGQPPVELPCPIPNERFAREPQSNDDAHRPVREDEDLARLFTWQEERKLSKNLTLNYKRVVYLVEPGPETLPLAGRRCRIYEHEDGRIEVRHGEQSLRYEVLFDHQPHVAQSAIVSNKRLDAVLAKISSDQQERDRTRLANRNVTLRQKQRIRASRTRADVQEPP